MKQSAAKTLGVAALGAAFAATGAGAAQAAPATPDAVGTLEGVARTLPAENVSQALPGAGHALTEGQNVAGRGLEAAQPVAQQLVAEQLANGPTEPLTGLLGGLPLQGLPTGGLPTGGLPVNGLPLG
ncbi:MULTISPECIES: ATP-binding protein [unclassified Streptomyces]|uniref:ATP-binding protein n=1 Tax=unclassified Streptomyces TaxID=2593676 RepID=UPI0019042CD9|nr:ATP-binding protein [Streptomyces sp. HSG2]